MDSEVEAIARRAIEAINDRSLAARSQELLDPNMVRHDLVELFPDSHGSLGGREFLGMVLAAIPDLRLTVQDLFGCNDRVTVQLWMTGTHTGEFLLGRPATGASLAASAVFIYRVQDGRIAEAWQMIDGLAFFHLVGLVK